MSNNTLGVALELSGSCQCGRVRFRARAAAPDAYYCHCVMCRKAFGNLFATFVNVRKEDVEWLSAPDMYASSKIARRGFCGQCGTPLSFEYLDSDKMDLAVGALDHPELMRPVAHVGVESRLGPFHRPDGLKEYRVADFQHILDKWKTAYGEDVVPGPRKNGS